MELVDTIRAWKDVDYRLSLDSQQQASVPIHPAGDIELLDGELEEVTIYPPVTSVAPECTAFY